MDRDENDISDTVSGDEGNGSIEKDLVRTNSGKYVVRLGIKRVAPGVHVTSINGPKKKFNGVYVVPIRGPRKDYEEPTITDEPSEQLSYSEE
ncbi:hypothetical protein HOI26_01010 [Candidatus Woesearchaeota archaeon]|nr:hypothetical protein [Candidatus Woesearchaeota archaeon]MBT5739654.1 hypothetical protein [Candidatus Woesearchaeota archaeon]